MQHKICFITALISFFVLVLLGCNNPDAKYAKVEGTITYNGQAVEGALVTFSTLDPTGESGSGETNAHGKYVLSSPGAVSGGTGVLPGEYTVIVKKTLSEATLHPDEIAHNEGKITYEEFQARKERWGQNAGTTYKYTELLPEKYGRPTSDLRATVSSGRNTPFDFDLKD